MTRADLIAAGDQSGCEILRSATIPAITGVAIDVPEKANSLVSWSVGILGVSKVTPGAAISGCIIRKKEKKVDQYHARFGNPECEMNETKP